MKINLPWKWKLLSAHLSGKRVGNSGRERPSSSYPGGNRLTEGSLKVKLPTIWTDEKQSKAEAERREERRSEKRKSKKKDADVRKGGEIANYCVFLIIYGSGGSKSRLAKAAGAEAAGQIRDEKLLTNLEPITSQNLPNTSFPDYFWKLKCRKNARRCHIEYISKSRKYTILGPLFEVQISACRCGAKHISKSKCTKYPMSGYFWKLRCRKRTRRFCAMLI